MITKKQAEYVFQHLAHKTKTYKQLGKEFGMHPSTLCGQMKKYKKDFGLSEKEKYCASTYLRYYYINEIIKQYQKGNSTDKNAQFYGFSDGNMIAELLRGANVPVRSVGYQSKTDQTLFDKIDDELQAYVLGLITSDGNVNEQYEISITLTESDIKLLKVINNRLLNDTGNLQKRECKNNISKPTWKLSFCGKKICKNLSKYGIVPRKNGSLTKLYQFNDTLMPHYLRGLYDGDGVCSKSGNYLRVGYCAKRKELTEDYLKFFVQNLGMKENKLFNTGNCWDCSWGSRKDLETFFNYIYKNATIFLPRKYQKLHNYLYGNTEVSTPDSERPDATVERRQ